MGWATASWTLMTEKKKKKKKKKNWTLVPTTQLTALLSVRHLVLPQTAFCLASQTAFCLASQTAFCLASQTAH